MAHLKAGVSIVGGALDYEIGTFLVNFYGSGDSANDMNAQTTKMSYTKIGRLVTIFGGLEPLNWSIGGEDDLELRHLPFACGTGPAGELYTQLGTCYLGACFQVALDTAGTVISGRIQRNSTAVQIYEWNASFGCYTLDTDDWSSDGNGFFNIQYCANTDVAGGV